MEHLPKRTSLVHETAATLKEWISTGILSEVLPGELRLKARLGVGRDTLRLALKLLTEEGWVQPVSRGQQRRAHARHMPPPKKSEPSQLPVLFLSPHPVEARVTLLEMEDTQVRLAEQGRSLRFVSPRIFHLKHPASQLERLVRAHPSAAWILYITTEAIQHWFEQRRIPTFLYELPFPDVRLPFVASDWEGAAFHAGIQLIRKGHRVIGLLEYQEQRPGLVAEERGLERALATVASEGRLLRFKDDRTPVSIARSLEAAFSLQVRPTAIVVTDTSQLLTCYSWLVSKGIRVPADISLVSLANDSWFDDLYPRVCYYQPDTRFMSRQIAQRVLELVQTGKVTKKSLRIQLKYVPGSTIGPARHSGT
jgi:LacI family transcriptional regulator